MMLNMHEAKSRLSELVEAACQGQEVIIARSGIPMVDLVPHRKIPRRRTGGQWAGRARIADDFDDPMPEIEKLFGT
jgi:prevent-host-death family protein